jgi:hypothetical protein
MPLVTCMTFWPATRRCPWLVYSLSPTNRSRTEALATLAWRTKGSWSVIATEQQEDPCASCSTHGFGRLGWGAILHLRCLTDLTGPAWTNALTILQGVNAGVLEAPDLRKFRKDVTVAPAPVLPTVLAGISAGSGRRRDEVAVQPVGDGDPLPRGDILLEAVTEHAEVGRSRNRSALRVSRR